MVGLRQKKPKGKCLKHRKEKFLQKIIEVNYLKHIKEKFSQKIIEENYLKQQKEKKEDLTQKKPKGKCLKHIKIDQL